MWLLFEVDPQRYLDHHRRMEVEVFQLMLVGVAAYTFWGGDRVERQIAGMFVAADLGSLLAVGLAANNFESPQWLLFGVDSVVLAGLLVLARKAGRSWLIWMLALQLITVMGHAARLLSPSTMNWVYYALTALLGYPMLALLGWAVWHRRSAATRSAASSPRSPARKD